MNRKLKQLISLLFMITLIVITSYFIFKDQSLSDLIEMLKNVNPFYVLLGLSMMFIFVGCEALNTFSIMRALGQKVSYLKCLGFAFIGFYFSSITPSSSGGQPAQMFYMNKVKISLSYSSLNLLIITVVYQIVMMIYGLIMFFLNYEFLMSNLDGLQAIKYFLIFSVTINTLLTIGILLAMFSQKIVYQMINALTKILILMRIKKVDRINETLQALVQEYTNGAAYIKTQPWLLVRVVLTTTIQLTATYMVPYFVYKAFNLDDYTTLQMIGLQALVSLAVSSIPLPGAVGASEGAFINAFKLFFGNALIVPAMLLCRGISFYAFLIISSIISMSVHFILTKEKPKNATSKSIVSV